MLNLDSCRCKFLMPANRAPADCNRRRAASLDRRKRDGEKKGRRPTVDRQKLQEHKTELVQTQRLAGIGTLAASVAHELNNPISIITTTCTDLEAQLETESLSQETLLRQLEVIEQSAWRCARLIQALRSYAHPDSQPVSSHLNKIIADALTLVAYQFQRQFNIIIVKELAAELPAGLWEPNQITQVLINLLTNARDALKPGGGTITVRSWLAGDGVQTGRVGFSVQDDGPGISEAVLPRIFEPFFTTKGVGEGTGLGLAIATEIVADHGGNLWCQTADGEGTSFFVELPCAPRTQKEPGAVPALPES